MKTKRMVYLLFAILVLFLSGCSAFEEKTPGDTTSNNSSGLSSQEIETDMLFEDEFRAVWIYYNELSYSGYTAEEFQADIADKFNNVKSLGLNAVIVHVRPFGDAYYPSEIFPWSQYLTGTEGEDPGYDPLAIMVDEAHKIGLQIHAWINPFRVRKDTADFTELAANNPARVWREDDDSTNDDWAVACQAGDEGQIYYNPAISEVRDMITDGVMEIVDNYDINGIQFDDYFYPTTDPSFDSEAYSCYTASVSGVPLPLEDWRRTNISMFISGIYRLIKSSKPDVVFGISPQANIEHNYESMFADVALWASTPGYVDYICPQIYFGFEYPKDAFQFENMCKTWLSLTDSNTVSLLVGLAQYKSGKEDAESTEWIDNNDIIAREIEHLQSAPECSGFILFSYGPLMSDEGPNQRERENMIEVLL